MLFFIQMSGQDVLMQDGNLVRCAPDRFYDSGGPGGSYGNNEDFTLTFCPQNSGELVGLDFSQFSTQAVEDVMTIYNGNSVAAPIIGSYDGMFSIGLVVAANQTGCLTVHFSSDNIGSTIGWDAEIRCFEQCQTITPNFTSNPSPNSGVIQITPGETVTFDGSATFSEDGSTATYTWDFGDGSSATGTNVSHQFVTPGNYQVEFSVDDGNPLGCSVAETVTVVVSGNSLITVNNPAFAESFFRPDELIEEVLVTGGCSEVENFSFQASGNPDQLSTKSYGYFTRGGATDFPFDEGIILSSGRAADAGNNPQGLISTDNGLPGDTDLESALSIVGTQNATFIKFNFTPTIDTINFRYLMASEEYDGSTECAFADSFAFLLREVGTTNYINLAVLPDGTPVSVTNINNAAACNSNPEFFEGYNLGATNFGGRTEVLTATANVIPNTTYEIKLVVADQGDGVWDSAIFLEAGSFNLGGELGEDITIAAGTAECGGDSVELDTNAPGATHVWYKDGVEITGETGSTLTVTEAGVYSADVIFAVGCQVSDSILVEFRTAPVIDGSASDLSTCSGSNQAEFDLTFNDNLILGTQDAALFNISYHTSFNDADTDVNPIANPTTYLGTDTDVIHFRIEDTDSGLCYETGSFTLNVFSTVTAEDVTFAMCDDDSDGDDTNGFVEFDLSAIDTQVLGTQDPSQFSVSYYSSPTDADSGTNALPNLYTNTNANTEEIYARVENDFNTDCYETSTITLEVNPLPVITSVVELRQCDDDTDGFSDFNLTEANDLITSNASNETLTYYLSVSDAENMVNEITNITAYTNTDPSSNPDILYVRVEDNNGCYRISELSLIVSTTQIPSNFNLLYEACDNGLVDDDITNGIATFDFSDATAQIEALYPAGQNVTVSYYETEVDALAEVNEIADISNYRNNNSAFSQNIVVRVDSDADNSCLGFGEHITLTTINPTPNTDPNNLVLCDDNNPGDLQEAFDLTVNEVYIFNGEADLSATYFTTYEDADLNVNPISNRTTYQNTSTPQTIFVKVTNDNSGCYAIVDFDISVNPLPATNTIEDYRACENGTDGFYQFDLNTKTEEILNGQDPNIFSVSYHETQLDVDNLTNPLNTDYTNTSNPQPIYVAITNTITGCSVSSMSFNLEVMEGAQANSDGEPLVYELCDNIGENDGLGQFDLSTLLDEVLDGQDPADYTITYHDNSDDANDNINPLPLLYENTSINGNPANPQIIYVRVTNNLSPDICFEVAEVTLKVNRFPEFELDEFYILCADTNGSEVVEVPPTITTGLSETDYSFEWSLNGTILSGETSSSIVPTQGGTYQVTVTDIISSTVTMCQTTKSTEVIESGIAEMEAEVTSEAFSGNHTVSVTVSGNSTYEYSLDYGPWQTEPEFNNVPGGIHTVLARDINGCGISSTEILAMDYKKYFTPNGDGNNESWNIVGIERQPTAKIYIFDRYGKLLKQLDPSGPGWDGTYRGVQMPSDDYWFVVEFTEPTTGQKKEFRSHFSLKR